MPELPEVETVVRGLEPVLLGRRFTRVEARRPDLRWPLPRELEAVLTGAAVTSLGRRGKYGLVGTDRGMVMIFHLGMSGRLRVDPPETGPHDHVLFETDAGRLLSFNDARRFGSLDLVPDGAVASYPALAALGPEPLSDAFDARYLATAVAGRAAPSKALLLDQRVVAGLGNIYVCEALYLAGISPARPGGSLKRREVARIVDTVKEVIAAAIEAGGSSLRDYVQVNGELGLFQHKWRVYGREGLACAGCGGEISRIAQSGRSTFLCGTCQS
jgi:formamidopyrimidine-DNA glycosylase